MKRNITLKLLSISALSLLLLTPLFWVGSIIDERERYKQQAFNDVTQMWTRQQLLAGPIIVQPYSVESVEDIWNKKTKQYEPGLKHTAGRAIILPQQLDITGQVNTETRQRGIYAIPVYTSQLNIKGEFSNQALLDLKNKHKDSIKFGKAYVSLPIRDMRGIKGLPKIQLAQQQYRYQPGSNIENWSEGLHATLQTLNADSLQSLPFSSTLELKGSSNISILPVGRASQIKLTSNWQHPSFQGHHLPEQHDISDQGFSAHWSTSPYSSDTQSVIENCFNHNNCQAQRYAVGVDLIQPVDAYLQAERSTKYGLLFIALTFAAFFLFEVMKQLQIHPIQYTMVGLSLALFFLLLISLSEQLNFGLAYLLSTLACIGLLTSYISAILQSKQRGLLFATGLSALYGFIYVIISSEDYALMMGAILLFAALAAIMLLTRNIDWYQLTKVKTDVQQELKL